MARRGRVVPGGLYEGGLIGEFEVEVRKGEKGEGAVCTEQAEAGRSCMTQTSITNISDLARFDSEHELRCRRMNCVNISYLMKKW